MKLNAKEELLNDFNKMISSLDFKNYNPSSPDFMSALFIGLMWQLLSDIPDEDMTHFGHDIEEELDGAEKYLECFKEIADMQYKQMANDELRHAKMLMNIHQNQELSDEEDAMITELEHRRVKIAERLA